MDTRKTLVNPLQNERHPSIGVSREVKLAPKTERRFASVPFGWGQAK